MEDTNKAILEVAQSLASYAQAVNAHLESMNHRVAQIESIMAEMLHNMK